MSYIPHHGDTYLLGDRNQLGYSLSGVHYSLNPNLWMMADVAIESGWIVSTIPEINRRITIADKEDITAILGIALNSTPDGYTSTVTKSSVSLTSGSTTFTVSSNTSLFVGMMVTGGNIPDNTYIIGISGTTIEINKFITSTETVTLTFGASIEVMSHGYLASETPIFEETDIGKALYPAPYAYTDYDVPGTTGGTTPQLTTDRGFAATAGIPLMEIGIVISPTTLLIDINGDSRGATGLVQISFQAGENITNNGIPLVVSLGTDGKLYKADCRKSQNGTIERRNYPLGFLTGANEGFGTSGTIDSGIPCIVQKLGMLPGFTGLSTGEGIYLHQEGAITSNLSAFNYYDNIITPLGVVISSTSIYTSIGVGTQSTDYNPIGSIIAVNPTGLADYGYLLCNGAVMNANTTTTNPTGQVAGTYDGVPLYGIIGTRYGDNGANTYKLPNLNIPEGPLFQIRYLSFYQANAPTAPLFRYEQEWTTWNSPTSITVDLTSFGGNISFTDVFAEIFVTNADESVLRKVEATPAIFSDMSGGSVQYKRYGYQLKKGTSSNEVIIEFGADGLAYYNNTGTNLTPIDGTWKYKVFIYKTEQFNKFYDYTANQKLNQLWSLGLADLSVATTSQVAGKFDRSSTIPTSTNRLNYNGNFYTTNNFSNTVTTTSTATLNNTVISNSANSTVPLVVTGKSGQSVNLAIIQKTGIAFPYFVVTSEGKTGISNTELNNPSSIFEVKGSEGTFSVSDTSGVLTFSKDGISAINLTSQNSPQFQIQMDNNPALHIDSNRNIGFGSDDIEQSSSNRVLEMRGNDDVSGSLIRLYSKINGIRNDIFSSSTGLVFNSFGETVSSKNIKFQISGTPGLYISTERNLGIGTESVTADSNIRVLDIRGHSSNNGVKIYLKDSAGNNVSSIFGLATGLEFNVSSGDSQKFKIDNADCLTLDSEKYATFSTRLGIGKTPSNLFEILTTAGGTQGFILKSSTKGLTFYPDSSSNAFTNPLIAVNNAVIHYTDNLVIGPTSDSTAKKGIKLDSNGNTDFWGTTSFQTAGGASSQKVEIASGTVSIRAKSSAISTTAFQSKTSSGNVLGSFGSKWNNDSTVDYHFISDSADGTTPLLKVLPTTGDLEVEGSIICPSLGKSGSPIEDSYFTNVVINDETVTTSNITTGNITTGNITTGNITTAKIGTLTGLGGGYITSAKISHLEVNGTSSQAPIRFMEKTTAVSPAAKGDLQFINGQLYFSNSTSSTLFIPLSNRPAYFDVPLGVTSIIIPPKTHGNEVRLAGIVSPTEDDPGLVPPLESSGQLDKYLAGDGTWKDFSTKAGVNNGQLSLNFIIDGTSQVSTTFSANDSGSKSFNITLTTSQGDTPNSIVKRTSEGAITAKYFNATSKKAYKENITLFTESALDILDRTEIVSFNFKEDFSKEKRIGFIADTTHAYMASEQHDRFDVTNTIGVMIKAIQELKKENDILKDKLNQIVERN